MKCAMKTIHLFAFLSLAGFLVSTASARAQPVQVQVDFAERLGPLELDRMALGQGGLSDDPMWADRIVEIRA